MLNYLETLREKSEFKRRQMAAGVAIVGTLVIAGVWIGTSSLVFRQDAVALTPEQQAAAAVSPVDSLQKNFSEGLNNIKSSLQSGPSANSLEETSVPSTENSNGVTISAPQTEQSSTTATY
jgi:hypothetical protein